MQRASRVQARIKQLCCLGLGGEAIMPALLQELRALIPSYASQFMWADERHELTNLYGEVPETAACAPIYVQEFYNRREGEVLHTFSDVIRNQRGVQTRDQSLTVARDTFYRSDCYNLLFRPLGYDDFLRLTVRESGRAPGVIAMFRQPNEPAFSAGDIRRLGELGPFIAHALTRKVADEVPLVETGETGLIVADGVGKPVYLSSEGRRLLFLATHPEIAPGRTMALAPILPAALVRICRNLAAVLSDDPSAAAPVHHHRNGWGGFTFRAYRLNESGGGPALVGITITREEPATVRVLRELEHLPLTHRQDQICMLLANGLSQRDIAGRLDISPHTVIAHTRAIYDALGVSSRTELLNRLLARNGQALAS
jgi:DNA-binding CsgD family transcriptional regulator